MNRILFSIIMLVIGTVSASCGDSGYLTPALLRHSEACKHLNCTTETTTDFRISGRWLYESCTVNETSSGSVGSCSGNYRICEQEHPASYGLAPVASTGSDVTIPEYQPFYASTKGTLANGSFILYGTRAPSTRNGCRVLSDLVLTCQSQARNEVRFQCDGFEHVRADQCDGVAPAGWVKYRATIRRYEAGATCPSDVRRP